MRVDAAAAELRPDAFLAGGILLLGQLEAALGPASPSWHQALLTVVWSLPLVWRRRRPVLVLALVVLTGPSIELVNPDGGVTSYVLAAMLAAFTVGNELDPPTSWWGPALTVGLPWAWYAFSDGVLSDFVFVALLYGGTWVVGRVLRHSRQRVDALAGEAQQLRSGAQEREQLAVAEERARIARELHDVVSHSISVITVQTQAVRRRMGDEHVEAANLGAIESTARQAMAEMRRLLGVLRASDDPLALAPQPGLDQLGRLVDELRQAGMELEVVVEGDPVPLSPGLDLTAYRVVQEGLTNACRHAPSAHVTVRLSYGKEVLVVAVDDDGRAGAPVGEQGHGLVGMRERVQLYRGSLAVGPGPGGGFGVQATLPLSSPVP